MGGTTIIRVDRKIKEGQKLQDDLNACLGTILDQDRFATKLANNYPLTDYNDSNYIKCAKFDKLVRTCYMGAYGINAKSDLWKKADSKNSNGNQYRGQCGKYWTAMQWMEGAWDTNANGGKAVKKTAKAKVAVKAKVAAKKTKKAKVAVKKNAKAKVAVKKSAKLDIKAPKIKAKATIKKRRLATFKDVLITRDNAYEVANGNGVNYDSYLKLWPDKTDIRTGKKLGYQFYYNSYLSRAPQGYSGCQAEKRYSTVCDLISNSRVMTNMNYKDMTMVAVKPEECPPCEKCKCPTCGCRRLTNYEIEALHKVTGLVMVDNKWQFGSIKCDVK